MIYIVAAVLGGLVVALGVLLVVRSAKGRGLGGSATGLGWAAFGLGVLTVLLAVVGYALAPDFADEAEAAASDGFDSQSLYLVATATGVAAAVTAALALKRGDRAWPTWVGLITGAAVILAWVALIVYIMLNPY